MDDKDWIRNNPENYVYCKHLKVIEMVMTADGIECPLYKCKKGHSICQESMKSPPCEDFELRNEITNQLTINELYDILTELKEKGHGDKEFQLLYDSETVYTTITKGSPIRIIENGVRFTDYK